LKGALTESLGHANQRLQTISEKVAVIDSARSGIADLARQVVGLNEVLGNKQARGAFGQIQMEDLVRDILPASSYEMQATLSNGKRVDCLIKLPKPPGPIGVDAKFPLESFRALRAATDDQGRIQALRAFKADVARHVDDIAGKYVVAGETADWALMFVPSEAVYADIHAQLPDTVTEAHRRRVGIVSPTTLMAALTTVRAIVMDAQMVARAEEVRAEIQRLKEDADRLDERAEKLDTAFNQMVKALREVRISSGKLAERIGRIADADVPDKPGPDKT
ncbi:MAG: DNA recombination protein RmuC, partial [Pseudomonadota bacterium]